MFSVVYVMLVCAFGLIEWFYTSVMHGGGGHGAGKKSLWMDAGLALAAYLVFHKIHGMLERWVERILFEKWHNNERKLRSFRTSPDARSTCARKTVSTRASPPAWKTPPHALRQLERKTGQQSKELLLMAGRRRSIRDVTEPQPASRAVSA